MCVDRFVDCVCACTCVGMFLLQVHMLQEALLVTLCSSQCGGTQLNPELVHPPAPTNQPALAGPCLGPLSTGITGGSLHSLDIYVGSGDDLHSQVYVAVTLTTEQSPKLLPL